MNRKAGTMKVSRIRQAESAVLRMAVDFERASGLHAMRKTMRSLNSKSDAEVALLNAVLEMLAAKAQLAGKSRKSKTSA